MLWHDLLVVAFWLWCDVLSLGSEEKRRLLASWVMKGENRQATEAHCIFSRSSAHKFEGTRELLTVREMIDRKIPKQKIMAIMKRGNGVKDEFCPEDASLTAYWLTTTRTKLDTEEVRQEAQVRMGMEVTEDSMRGMLDIKGPGGMPTGQGMSEEQLAELTASVGGGVTTLCCV